MNAFGAIPNKGMSLLRGMLSSCCRSTPPLVRGFVVALPTMWTRGEDNNSGMNLTTLADVDQEGGPDKPQRMAVLSPDQPDQMNT